MDNKNFWKGASIALSGVLVQVFGLINILYYLFTILGGCIYSLVEGYYSFGSGIEEYIEMYCVETMNFWALLIIFIVGLIYTNIGIDMLNSNPIRYKEQFKHFKENLNDYIENMKPQVNTNTNVNIQKPQSEFWECESCSFINKSSSKYCANCGKRKEDSL